VGWHCGAAGAEDCRPKRRRRLRDSKPDRLPGVAMDAKTKRFIRDIVNSQRDLTLATLREDGYPRANTVSYVSEGMILYVGRMRDSRNVKNLEHCNKVSLAIDVPYAEWSEIRGLSMAGRAEMLADDSAESRRAMELIAKRFPAFVDRSPPSDPGAIVFVRITPEVVSILDYRKAFGHTELVRVDAADLRG
jgi:nitroimidazol reductase NimA-like FMN-containing flavoprotein (pyridoxamine 5'-phosphate oxidase superfamily)